jgi:hypothetical protein
MELFSPNYRKKNQKASVLVKDYIAQMCNKDFYFNYWYKPSPLPSITTADAENIPPFPYTRACFGFDTCRSLLSSYKRNDNYHNDINNNYKNNNKDT